jgi:hypothetical protein
MSTIAKAVVCQPDLFSWAGEILHGPVAVRLSEDVVNVFVSGGSAEREWSVGFRVRDLWEDCDFGTEVSLYSSGSMVVWFGIVPGGLYKIPFTVWGVTAN